MGEGAAPLPVLTATAGLVWHPSLEHWKNDAAKEKFGDDGTCPGRGSLPGCRAQDWGATLPWGILEARVR